MKCHYIYTEEGEKVLIPGCRAVAISGDIRDCTCKDEITWMKIEEKKINEILTKMKFLPL